MSFKHLHVRHVGHVACGMWGMWHVGHVGHVCTVVDKWGSEDSLLELSHLAGLPPLSIYLSMYLFIYF